MINSIMEAISIALNAEFGDRYQNYMEEISQDFAEPCFFIQCLNPTDKLFFGRRYFRKNQFCIQYFPEDKLHGNRECNAVAERLFVCLEYLSVDDNLIMGTHMHGEMADGILHFFVNYDMFVYRKSEPVPFMEEMELRKERRHYGSGKDP